VENNQTPEGTSELALGPLPARRTATRPPLSTSRAALLETLQGQPEPTTLVALIAATGLHANTLREHLDALVKHGLVRRHHAEPSGRGRPAWLYEATPVGEESGLSEYAGLATAPFGAYYFQRVAPLTIVANMAAAPAMWPAANEP